MLHYIVTKTVACQMTFSVLMTLVMIKQSDSDDKK